MKAISLAAGLIIHLILSSPASGAGRELETPVPGPTAASARGASTAFAGDRFLTVWQRQAGASSVHLFGTFSAADGSPLSRESFPIVVEPVTGSPSAIGMGDHFGVFYRAAYPSAPYLLEIDVDGLLLSKRRLPPDTLSVQAWNGRYFLGFRSPRNMYSGLEPVLFDREGNVVRGYGDFEQIAAIRVAALRDHSFLVVTTGWNETVAMVIAADGTAGSRQVVERAAGSATTEYHPASPSISDTDRGAFISYVVSAAGKESLIRIATVDPAGVVLAPSTVSLPGYVQVGAVHVAQTGAGYGMYVLGSSSPYPSGGSTLDLLWHPLDAQGHALGDTPTVVAARVATADPAGFVSNSEITLAILSFPSDSRPLIPLILRGPTMAVGQTLALTPSTQAEVRLGANTRGFVAVWNDFVGGGTSVHAAAVGEDGTRISPVISFPGDLVSRHVASGPVDHLFLRATATDLIATRIAPDGRPLHDVVITRAHQSRDAAAVWTGAGFLVSWSTGSQIFTTFLVGNEREPVARELPIPVLPPNQNRSTSNIRIAFDGTTALVAWDDRVTPVFSFPNGGGPEPAKATAMRLSPTGLPIDSLAVELGIPGSHLLAGGDGQFLAYSALNRSAYVIRAQGRVEVGTPTVIPGDFHSIVDIWWSGSEYIAALRAVRNIIGYRLLGRNGSFAGQPHATSAGDSVDSVQVRSQGARVLAVAAVIDRASPARANAFGAADLEVVPSPPGPVRITEVKSEPGGITIISWDPIAGATGYTVEVLSAGRFTVLAFARESETFKAVPQPVTSTFRVRAFNTGGFSVADPAISRRRSVRR